MSPTPQKAQIELVALYDLVPPRGSQTGSQQPTFDGLRRAPRDKFTLSQAR